MSAPSHHILFAHGPTWQVATVTAGRVTFADMLAPASADATPQAIAQRLAEQLAAAGYARGGVMLAIGAADCLAATIDLDGVGHGDRKAMLYQLEGKLPLAAESVVADFAISPDGRRALGVCVREDSVAPLLNCLESLGVAVQSVSPAALLAAQQLASSTGLEHLLIAEGDDVNLLTIRDGRVLAWSLLPAAPTDVRLQLDALALELSQDAPVRSCGTDPSLALGHTVDADRLNPRTLAATTAAAALEGRLQPWVELRRDTLAARDPLRPHRKPLDALLAAAALFLACLAIGLVWRAHRYAAQATAAEHRMADEFTAAFPGWSLPSNVAAVVDSERRKASGAHGSGLPPEARESAVRTLYAVLSNLPAGAKFHIEQVTFDDASFTLALKLRSWDDLDKIATATRAAGFEVPLAKTERSADGFLSATLRGQRRPSAKPIGVAAGEASP